MTHTPGPWSWHDAFGRKNGKGEPRGIGKGITGDIPETGSCSRFSFAISDEQGFGVAHCTNPLVTMSDARSEANARLMASSPDLYEVCKILIEDIENDNELESILKMAHKAIAKAEGREV